MTTDRDALRALWAEPHHLGYPMSGRTGTYDRDTILVKRDWYIRLAALAAAPVSGGDVDAAWEALKIALFWPDYDPDLYAEHRRRVEAAIRGDARLDVPSPINGPALARAWALSGRSAPLLEPDEWEGFALTLRAVIGSQPDTETGS